MVMLDNNEQEWVNLVMDLMQVYHCTVMSEVKEVMRNSPNDVYSPGPTKVGKIERENYQGNTDGVHHTLLAVLVLAGWGEKDLPHIWYLYRKGELKDALYFRYTKRG